MLLSDDYADAVMMVVDLKLNDVLRFSWMA